MHRSRPLSGPRSPRPSARENVRVTGPGGRDSVPPVGGTVHERFEDLLGHRVGVRLAAEDRFDAFVEAAAGLDLVREQLAGVLAQERPYLLGVARPGLRLEPAGFDQIPPVVVERGDEVRSEERRVGKECRL